MVLEGYDHAVARGARMYCELSGFASRSEAYHMAIPSPNGDAAAACMAAAMQDAGIVPVQVNHVMAHGTGTVANDVAETCAINRALGTHAATTPVTSIKGACGHTLGAAGAIEAVAAALAIQHGVVPPTVNCCEPAKECDLDYVIGGSRETFPTHVLCNSFGFGGTDVCLVFSRCES